MTRDIVLITIDCWRHDAVERMPNLQAATDDFTRTDAFCQASSTRGAFPALLSGQYYPQVYDGFSTIRPGVRTLPGELAEAGYETAGICGSNPFLSPWGTDFGHFWNDDLDHPGSAAAAGNRDAMAAVRSNLRHLSNYLRLRSRVPASDVANRARNWYEDSDGPRFLWMHLMDLHVPFLPGLRKGFDEGLVDIYRSHLQFLRDPEAMSEADRRTLERLYWRSVERLDEQVDRVLEFLDDDALVVLVGDHGEEFDHGKHGHARLYDECVRVPLLANDRLAERAADLPSPMRQLDVPATLLDAVDRPVPPSWEGTPAGTGDRWPMFSINHSQQFEEVYAAVRAGRYKLVKTFDETMTEKRTEGYDLLSDGAEQHDVAGDVEALDELDATLRTFLDREDIRTNLLERPTERGSAAVENRLKALGYK